MRAVWRSNGGQIPPDVDIQPVGIISDLRGCCPCSTSGIPAGVTDISRDDDLRRRPYFNLILTGPKGVGKTQ